MLIGQWASGNLPEREQFGFVRDLLLSTPVPVRIERPRTPSDQPFQSAAWIHSYGPDVSAVRTLGEAAAGYRQSAEIARGAPESLWVLQYRASRGEMLLDGRPVRVEPGDVLFGHCGVEQIGDGGHHVDFTMWMLPLQRLTHRLRQPEGNPVGVVRHDTPMGRLTAGYLAHLGPAIDAAPADAAGPLVDNLLQLLAISHGMAPDQDEPGARAVADARLEAIRRDIRTHYADPALSPPVLAARHHLSLRALHLLFEPTGTSCARFIQDCRLQAAAAELANPAQRHRSVADIAYGCGFESLATFHRNFRAAFGHAPAELRERS